MIRTNVNLAGLMGAVCLGLLDALGIKKAHIVGVSMGGMIGQRVAYNHPERIIS